MPDLSFIRECAEDTSKRNYDRGYKEGYRKAIDELCKEISKLLSGDTKHLEGEAYYKELAYLKVLKMAEQMKGER